MQLNKLVLQAALDKDKNSDSCLDEEATVEDRRTEGSDHESEPVKSVTSQLNELGVSDNPVEVIPPSDSTEGSCPGVPGQDIDKKIRALRKKVILLFVFLD